jgi:pimeloyl-ACP methyl ester carboxylesterase
MQRFQTDGLWLYYTDDGAGLPVLCLSGLTRTGADFDYVAPHLPGFRLIRMDYRGRGQSDWADPGSYTIAKEAQDVLVLLDHLGLAKVAILGSSRGGLIAMWLAVIAKDRLLGVALNDIGPEISVTGLEVIKSYVGRNPEQSTWLQAAQARTRAMKGFVGVPDSRWLDEVKHHYDQTATGLVIRYDPRLRDTVLAAGPVADAWPLFAALADLPVALIRGANSDLLTAETAAELCRHRPDMIFAEVPGRGHIPFLDEPESLAALRGWLASMA